MDTLRKYLKRAVLGFVLVAIVTVLVFVFIQYAMQLNIGFGEAGLFHSLIK